MIFDNMYVTIYTRVTCPSGENFFNFLSTSNAICLSKSVTVHCTGGSNKKSLSLKKENGIPVTDSNIDCFTYCDGGETNILRTLELLDDLDLEVTKDPRLLPLSLDLLPQQCYVTTLCKQCYVTTLCKQCYVTTLCKQCYVTTLCKQCYVTALCKQCYVTALCKQCYVTALCKQCLVMDIPVIHVRKHSGKEMQSTYQWSIYE